MTAIFVVLGLFSIAAGLLLVFLILVMLAAERRSEMGMARAVGMKRLQLIESFMAEGMAYSVTAAAAGALLGVLVSLGMTRAMAYIFNAFDVGIAFHVTWQSLVIAYCLGVVPDVRHRCLLGLAREPAGDRRRRPRHAGAIGAVRRRDRARARRRADRQK